MKKITKTQVSNKQKQIDNFHTKKTTEIQQESMIQSGRDSTKQSFRSSQSPSQHSSSSIVNREFIYDEQYSQLIFGQSCKCSWDKESL
ncbi:unnamed protein product [Paramecium primaurelia]|uniref:Uncharacterized protein n=1 Tax=Paramecium primaurelia TaxID=5886 RepID=A0A8S1PUA9_PARPR|nr:unnamed protein product [Paramecium primaurelia]